MLFAEARQRVPTAVSSSRCSMRDVTGSTFGGYARPLYSIAPGERTPTFGP